MRRLLERLSTASCILLGAAIVCAMAVRLWPRLQAIPTVHAQGDTRTVIIDPPHSNDPIEVVRVEGEGKAAAVGAPTDEDLRGWPDGGRLPGNESRVAYRLTARGDWINTLSFALRNRSSEKIAAVEVRVFKPAAVGILGEFRFGRRPPAAAYTVDGRPIPQTREPINFNPNEQMSFSLADDQVGLDQLEEARQSSVSQVYVLFWVYLEDGLKWWEYQYDQPDPEHLGHWLLAPSPYFPPSSLPGPHLKKPTP